MSEDGHHYAWGAPPQGWPTFDNEGKVVRAKTPAEKARERTEAVLQDIDDRLSGGA